LDRLKKELQEVKVEKEQLSIDCKNLVSEKEHQYILIDKTRKKAEESQSRLEEATSTNENLKRKIAQLKYFVFHVAKPWFN
jgi:predicted RND superfamily exporter protein